MPYEVAIIVALGSLAVSLLTQLRLSRCTEMACSDCCFIKRTLVDDSDEQE